jgi:hypothetical protein
MNHDRTQPQSALERAEAEQMSLRGTTAPGFVPGVRLDRFLGRGAFGQVWVGRDLNTGREVAVKFYLHRSGVNWSLLRREVRTLVALSTDRHVVQVLDVGWEAEPPYYVMEFMPNGSLEELLQARGTMTATAAVDLLHELCLGMNHAHGRGVLHCDLKPANVLLDAQLRPRLADFGQSRLSSEQLPALGTLFYMAPEQADLEAVPEARWDVYALGAILFRMLVGHPPHRTEQFVDRLAQCTELSQRLHIYREELKRRPVDPSHHRLKGVDRPLASIIDRCLHPDPRKRFGNVEQVLEALDSRQRQRARRPLLLLGIVGPLLLLLLTGLFGLRAVRQAREQSSEALQREALSSSRFAAKFAASTMSAEIDQCFTFAQQEATRDELHSRLKAVLSAPTLTPYLANRGRIGDRTDFLSSSERKSLESLLEQRLLHYESVRGVGQPSLASCFVMDDRGTILASAFRSDGTPIQSSDGQNFAFRSYFHGGPKDLDPSSSAVPPPPLTSTRLSAPFQSSATGLWKIAVATPILQPDAQSPIGVFVITVNFGDFELLGNRGSGGNQLALVVDVRRGANRGTILQHPLLEEARADNRRTAAFHLPADVLDRLLKDGSDIHADPLAQAPGGEELEGNWLSAIEPIALPRQAANAEIQDTGLVVLIQYRLAEVVRPVAALVDRLLLEGFATMMAILLITSLLWGYVLRSIDRSSGTPAPAAGGSTGGSAGAGAVQLEEAGDSPATLDYHQPFDTKQS